MSFDEALKEFGKSLGKLKKSYAEECNCNPGHLSVIINEDDYVAIIPTDEEGSYIESFRGWVDTEE